MAKPPRKITDPAEARRLYEKARQSVIQRVTDPKARDRALAKFDSDPRTQAMRRVAGMPSVTAKRQELKGEARKQAVREAVRRDISRRKERNKDSIVPESVRDVGAGLLGSANDALFGLPARASAAILGVDNDLMQEYADQQGQRAPVTNFIGTLAASIPTGGGLIKGGSALATRLATSSARPVAAAGRAAQAGGRALTLKRGQTAKNAARLAATGAAFGAATEAGKGRDVATGAGYGAAGAVALGAGAKAGGWLASKAGEALRVSGADSILRRYTTTTREELQRRLDDFRARGKAEPTIYELLNLEDRQALQKVFGRLSRPQQERGAELARQRVESIPGEVAQVVRNATRGQRKRNIGNLATAQAKSRGATAPTPAEARLAVGAADNPTRLAQIRRDEARNIMAPFDGQQGAASVKSLIPTELRALDPKKPGELTEVEIDPEMAAVIRSAAGLARIRNPEEGLTVREITGMISKLKEIATGGSDPIQRGNAQRAVDHLEDELALNVPGIRSTLERMNEAWAARSRQLEGMRETRPQADVDPSTSQRLRRSENVFETPEGAVGRAAAQRGALIDDLGEATAPALGTVRRLAESPTAGREISQNLGVPATREITEAARAQAEGARRLAAAVRDPKFDAAELEAGDLAVLAAALNPSSMAYTKARALTVIFDRLAKSIPESRSRVIVDMLFSRDPAMTARAVNALRSQGRSGVDALTDIVKVAGGAMTGASAIEPRAPGEPSEEMVPVEETAETDLSQLSDDELLAMYEGEQAGETDLSQLSDDELLAMYEGEQGATEEMDSPYAGDLETLYAEEDPALVDLIERVSRQESGGKQFDNQGRPLRSKAGAVGVMQVMPTTGPEAARLAGVEWDKRAYENDPAYNKLIGIAYLSEMLRRYDGDVELALVAYNAGPKRADAYSKGRINFSALPAETQEYVRRIM